MASPLDLLRDVHQVARRVPRLRPWLDVVGWYEPAEPGESATRPGTEPGEVSTEPDRLLSVREACRLTGLGRTTLWAMERRGEFPRRVQVSAGRVAFRRADVAGWIEARRPR
jgi:prophage regulatory protein